MKKQDINQLMTEKLIALASKHNGNLADIRLTDSSYDMTDGIPCHLTAIDSSLSVFGSLRFLHRLMEVMGIGNCRKDDQSAFYWIQPVEMEAL